MTTIAHHVTLPADTRSTAVAEAFARLLGDQVRVSLTRAEPHWWVEEMRTLGTMDVVMLRALWDCYDGSNAPLGFAGETIHAALGMCGDGAYCAV